jgi:integrase
VFLGPKGGILRRSFEARVFRPAVQQAGLPDNLTFHGLRHLATTRMIANNDTRRSSSTASATPTQ